MGDAQAGGRLRIGVPPASPPIGFVAGPIPSEPEVAGARARGLAVDLGRLVADALHVRAEYVALSTPAMFARLDRAELELAFPDVALTERGMRTYSLTNPYAVVHQRLLVARRARVASVEDLAGETVCEHVDPATGADLEALEPGLEVVAPGSLAGCARLFRRGRVDAITADDLFLRHLLRDLDGKLVGDDLTTAAYGAAVTTGASNFGAIVEQVFADAEADGTWARILRRWLGAAPGEPPELTAEEAAALFPTGAGGSAPQG